MDCVVNIDSAGVIPEEVLNIVAGQHCLLQFNLSRKINIAHLGVCVHMYGRVEGLRRGEGGCTGLQLVRSTVRHSIFHYIYLLNVCSVVR